MLLYKLAKCISGLIFVYCAVIPSLVFGNPADLPLLSFQQIQASYIGAFRTTAPRYGDGRIAYNHDRNSLYISGSVHKFEVGEYSVPALVNTKSDLSSLNTSTTLQSPAQLLGRVPSSSWPTQAIDNRLMGMLYVDGKLIVNGAVYYDGGGNNTDTTFRIENPNDLAGSPIAGNFRTQGAQHTTMWMSMVPAEWREAIGYDYISGAGLGLSIISRLSAGPSMFGIRINDYLNANTGQSIASKTFMDFPVDNPIRKDFLNYGGATGGVNNDVHTMMSTSTFGFIVPGSRTYVVFGRSAGHTARTPGTTPYVGEVHDFANKNGTINYKDTIAPITGHPDDKGNVTDGYSVYDSDDKGPFYWLFDVAEIVSASAPWNVQPYEYGYFPEIFARSGDNNRAPSGSSNAPLGGSWDPISGRLFLSWPWIDNSSDPLWTGSPVVSVYQIGGGIGDKIPNPPVLLEDNTN